MPTKTLTKCRSHDIGGHFNGYRDDELAARWVQLGVFSPILRLHSSNNPWNSKEPWRFTQESRSSMNNALRLRHQMIPYLYSMNVKAARDGEPLIQPMYYNCPEHAEAYRVPNQFFFGSELIAMPMTTPRDRVTCRARARAWLPPGRHVDTFSGAVYDGDCEKWLYRRLEEYAVFAHEGSIIPHDGSDEPDNGGGNPEKLALTVVVGADGAFEMFEDDGKGSDVEDIKWAITRFEYKQKSGTLDVEPPTSQVSWLPSSRHWTIRVLALRNHKRLRVLVDGAEHKIDIQSTDSGTVLELGKVAITSKITVELGDNPQLAVTDAPKHIFRVVDDAQMEFEPKKLIWSIVTRKAPLNVKVSQLSTMDLDSRLLQAIMEFLCADSRVPVEEVVGPSEANEIEMVEETKQTAHEGISFRLPMT